MKPARDSAVVISAAEPFPTTGNSSKSWDSNAVLRGDDWLQVWYPEAAEAAGRRTTL